jgi:hypothetical protein
MVSIWLVVKQVRKAKAVKISRVTYEYVGVDIS